MTTIIQAQQLDFSYGSHQVLKNLTLMIQAGEIIGLIGENGAGKTTLLNLLLGVNQPQHGQLTLWGHQPGVPVVQTQIGSMLQGDIAVQGITVGDVLKLTARHYPAAFAVPKLLAQLQLTDLANKRLTALSGGQLRRVTFALALVGNPNLLFLDEPTVGMDVTAQRTFWARIAALKTQGKTIIMTSHYLDDIQQVADRIFLLRHGQLAFQGTFRQLQDQYRQVEIVAQTTLAASTFNNLPGVTAVDLTAGTLHLSSEDGDGTLQALVPYLSELHQIVIRRESLADIFVHLVRGASA